jgi:hypothetical protein
MAEPAANALGGSDPTAEEAQGWIGFRVDEMTGSNVGRVQEIYVDAGGGGPTWVIVKVGRFGKLTAIPFRDCAPGAGHIWAAHRRDAIRGAPAVDAGEPLTREAELELCAHYGIREGHGRAAELAARPGGAITAHAPTAEPAGSG